MIKLLLLLIKKKQQKINIIHYRYLLQKMKKRITIITVLKFKIIAFFVHSKDNLSLTVFSLMLPIT